MNTEFYDNTYGVSLQGDADPSVIIKSKISNNIFEDNTYGIYLYYGNNNSITDNYIHGGTYAIRVRYKSNDSIITGNIVNGATNGIYLTDGSNFAIVKDNIIRFCTNAMSVTGTSCIVRDNIGYVTESWGKCARQDNTTIAHNLSTTPRYVYVTGSWYNTFVNIINISSTTFTISVKKHDGNAGVNQTIYWYAKY